MSASRLAMLGFLACALLCACGAGAARTQPPEGCTRFESADGRALYLCDEETSAPRITASAPPPAQTRPRMHGLRYRFVRITDESHPGDTADAGADIDAIVLRKANGTMHFASYVEAFAHGGGLPHEFDPGSALGAPDAFSDWESADPVCELSEGLVSLGGSGGLLVVGFDVDIETGDSLTVLEAGGCTGNDGPEGISDRVEVSIGVDNDLQGSWIFVTSGEGPVIRDPVPELPR